MVRPVTTVFSERVYDLLPQYLRDQDEQLDYPLLRFVSLMGDQADQIRNLHDRISYVPVDDGGTPGDTSDLADPLTADEAWLPFIGQLVGADTRGLTGVAARDAVLFASDGWRAGTRRAVADAARSALTGTKYVQVYDHSINVPGDGGRWDVLLVTRVSETPDVDAVLAAVVEKGAKPVGVVLHHRAYSAPYSVIQTETTPDTYAGRQTRFPTYRDVYNYLP